MKEIKPLNIILPFWFVLLIMLMVNTFKEYWTFMQMFRILLLGFVGSVGFMAIIHLGINPHIRERNTLIPTKAEKGK